MKKNIYNILLLGGIAMAMVGCDVNDWNDHLDGFEGDPAVSDMQALEYTFTAADYSNLAANSANVAKAAELDLANELKTVGSKGYFTDKITAKDFIPAFLSDPDFAYFSLSDGSAIKITYNVAGNLPEEIPGIEAAGTYKLSESDYMDIWGSNEDFVEAFAPSKVPAKFISNVLDNAGEVGEEGAYMLVQYNTTNQEPIFSTVEPEPTPAFPLSDVIGSVALDDVVEINGVITAICQRGYILTDNSGSILIYYGSAFVPDDWEIGNCVTISGTISSYGKGFQIDGTTATASVVDNMAYTYPAPKVLTGADFDSMVTRTTDELAMYCKFDCTVAISGNYYNFKIDGAETAQGSIYQGTAAQKAAFTDGQAATVCGYFVSISSGKFANFVITSVNGTPVSKRGASTRKAAADVPTTVEYALYQYTGSAWKAVTNVDVVNPADYKSMGQSYNNLSSATDAAYYLPRYLAGKHPYAKEGDSKIVCYYLYSGGKTSIVADNYKFDGTVWVLDNGVVTETAQFVRNKGAWMYDPNVTITLPAGKSQPLSTLYYQACTDWVWANVDQKMGVTEKGKGYVTSYGNNEYYCGTSAYQGNVDIRPAKAKEQYPEGYEGMTDEEITQLMKDRFTKEVLPGALATLHPEAAPIDGLDVLYTINFAVYTGSTSEYTVVYKVVGKGQFEFVSCTWDAPAE